MFNYSPNSLKIPLLKDKEAFKKKIQQETQLVFRIADDMESGPYRSNHGFAEEFFHYDEEIWPTPFEENSLLGIDCFEEWCGFSSVRQLLNWFPQKERKYLRAHNFYIWVFKISKNHIRFGEKQIVFKYKYRGQGKAFPIPTGKYLMGENYERL